MLYKSNKLFMVKIAKAAEKADKKIKFKYNEKYYAAYLMKVGKNCCIYKILDKDALVLDNVNLVNTVGEYFIYYKEAMNFATGLYKKEYYSQEEIQEQEKKVNESRKYERDLLY